MKGTLHTPLHIYQETTINNSKKEAKKKVTKHTPKKVVLQAPSRHKFINQQPLIIFYTITNQLNQVWMNEVT